MAQSSEPVIDSIIERARIDDVLNVLLDHTNLCDVDNVVLSFATDIKQALHLKTHRYSLNRVFTPLVSSENLDHLYAAMTLCGVVLSGSRAADYFQPGSCVAASDFDFYVTAGTPSVDDTPEPHNIDDSASKFHGFLTSIGVAMDSMAPLVPSSFVFDNVPTDAFYPHFSVTAGISKSGKKVQMIRVSEPTVLDAITNFHSTPPQCFITGGYAAVHMYGALSKEGKMFPWDLNVMNQNSLRHGDAFDMGERALTYRKCPVCGPRDVLKLYPSTRHAFLDALDYDATEESREKWVQDNYTAGMPLHRAALAAAGLITCSVDGPGSAGSAKYQARGYRRIKLDDLRARPIEALAEELDYPSGYGPHRLRRIGDEETTFVTYRSFATYAAYCDVFDRLCGESADSPMVESEWREWLAKKTLALKDYAWLEETYWTVPWHKWQHMVDAPDDLTAMSNVERKFFGV
ncbi:hypothetical protein BDV96DRAFT_584937 [Lophiotrema nucula]|uniref:Uncharacterized protein n=1 Tax=Lophiotrema nucula TaxID=690887 RepID=A0A6A5YS24_9PLEO|nr:hypothetical protein BDV96DRAFT_584937 [Lophiotrema nucula]